MNLMPAPDGSFEKVDHCLIGMENYAFYFSVAILLQSI